MIDLALEPYPKEVKKYLIVNPDLLINDELNYLKNIENVEVLEIEGHKNGPSYSIYLVKDKLPKNYSYFISYVDIYWTWNFDDVKIKLDYQGIIFTRRQFHPHLFKNNFSAFCKPKGNNLNLLLEIKEKGSFTEDHMNEPLSVGTFYFKSGSDMLDVIEKQITNNKRVASEFYPSEIFNELLNQNIEVYLYDVDFFIHFGLPEQLNDFNHWSVVMNHKPIRTEIKNICIMGGLGKRMKVLSNEPKALIKFRNLPMFEYVLSEFGSDDNIIVTTNDIVSQLPVPKINYSIINIGKQTNAQIETITNAVNDIKQHDNFFMISCDAFGIFDNNKLKEFIKKNNPDCIIFTFTPTLMQIKMAGHHTHVSTNDDLITEVHIKSKSSDEDKGLGGFFWFKTGKIFDEVKNIPNDLENEQIADHFLKHLVNKGYIILGYHLDNYCHIGTVPEFREFKFWENYTKVLLD
ncbi:NTP transferase domain-containing protein [Candidatus Woesearchaeota archaeon]|nr:NTP transferase domain-containing protein [Candidatus Woesearchaeota archaeon]